VTPIKVLASPPEHDVAPPCEWILHTNESLGIQCSLVETGPKLPDRDCSIQETKVQRNEKSCHPGNCMYDLLYVWYYIIINEIITADYTIVVATGGEEA